MTVRVRVTGTLSAAAAGENDFWTPTFFCDEILAWNSAALVTPCVLVTAPAGMVLVIAPSTRCTTSTLTTQDCAGARDAPLRLITLPLAGADTTPPEQVVLALGTAEIFSPAGRLSGTPTPVSAITPVLLSVMLSWDGWPGLLTAFGLKLLVTDAAPACLVSVALTALGNTMPLSAVMPPAGMVFTEALAVVAVTSNNRSQLPPGDRVAPLRTRLPPAVLMAVGPVQVVAALGLVASVMPAIVDTGSLTLTLVSTAVPMLPSVMRTRVTPPTLTGLLRKVLVAVSAGVYCRVAVVAVAF